MKYIKTYEDYSEYKIGDYILINTKIIKEYNFNLPYGKILEIIYQSITTLFRIEVIIDGVVFTDFHLFSGQTIRKLKKVEIDEFESFKNTLKYNL